MYTHIHTHAQIWKEGKEKLRKKKQRGRSKIYENEEREE
jgi:hypothetical protein